MSKDNIGCTIMAIVAFSIMGTAIYLINRQDRIEEERKAMIEATSTGLDEYIIIDRKRCAHAKQCTNLRWYVDSTMYTVNYIDTFTIKESDFDYVCVGCMGKKEYKNLKRIAKRNSEPK